MNHSIIKPNFVILTGGQSVRMQQDKAFVKIGKNSTFLTRLLKKLKYFNGNIYFSLRQNQIQEYSELIQNPNFLVDQNIPAYGPLKGILSTYSYFSKKKNIEHLFFLPVDIPFVKLRTINRLLQINLKSKTKLPGVFYESSTGLEPLCGIYSMEVLSKWYNSIISKVTNDFSLQKRIICLNPKPYILKLPIDEEFNFRNINTKEDLQKTRQDETN
ncbi:molybdenum cofactor guanylyltransferase [Leptospira sp. 96542]|nr:molybdenum cofactor guanylyltransferase [Leptospira sp. 96542]